MFGLEFLFTAALWALPLAALPLILHLLYRSKSPVVQFPSLRFIRSSIQQNAARRKVQKWLLLAVRMLLLALLIWAVAQPAKILASRFFGAGSNAVAAVVIDTSWSMQYREDQVSLLSKADAMVQQLLREQLKDGSILLLTTGSTHPGQVPFRNASEILSQWSPLQPQAAVDTLSDRIAQARDILEKQPAGEKMLVVLSDFQAHEFPRPLADKPESDIRTVVLDLRPERPRSAGVRSIVLTPPQPIAGVPVTATVELSGPPGDVRPVSLALTTLEGKELLAKPPAMASFDDSGRAQVRFEFQAPADHWQLIKARLEGNDPMPWDDQRTLAIELPPQQLVNVLPAADAVAQARKLVTLALDPNQGALPNWPLKVVPDPQGTNVQVALLDRIPPLAALNRMRDFVNSGNTLILMLKPGFESAFQSAPEPTKLAMASLLPSRPYVDAKMPELLHAVPAAGARQEPATAGLLEDARTLELLRASRIVPMTVADVSSTRMLLGSAGPSQPAPSDRNGLLYVKRVGRGRIFIWSCIPESVNSNLGTHALFLPLLVNQCLRAGETSGAANSELGTPVACDDPRLENAKELELRTPANELFHISANKPGVLPRFAFPGITEPGVYRWYRPGMSTFDAISNVSVPGDETEALYRAAETVIPRNDHTVIARSMDQLQQLIAHVSQPQPKWSLPIAIALMFLCAEALMSTETGLWTWFRRK